MESIIVWLFIGPDNIVFRRDSEPEVTLPEIVGLPVFVAMGRIFMWFEGRPSLWECAVTDPDDYRAFCTTINGGGR